MHQDALRKIAEDHNPWWTIGGARRALAFPAKRDLYEKLLRYAAATEARRAALIIGPRQVGKTVMLWQLVDGLLEQGWPPKNVTYFDFSDDRLTEEITPRSVADLAPSGYSPEKTRIFLFDEISKAARWGAWLKQAVDAGKNRFIVTDSAASVMRSEARESGQGRWDELRIEGLSFKEYLRLISMPGESPEQALRRVPNSGERYLAAGGFPEHVFAEDFYRVRERIREDISDRAILRDLLRLNVEVTRLKALFSYLVQDSGAIFNASIRARELNADPRSVDRWVSLLEDTHLIARLLRRTGNAAARLRAQPRIYAADHGLVSAFAPGGSLERDQNTRGRVVEAVVFRHLRDVARELRGELSFFRDQAGLEADFVLDFDRGPIVIEVTASSDPPSGKFHRLAKIGKLLKASRSIMIHGGIVGGADDRSATLPLAEFLMRPSSILEMRK
ncbi:MAG: ATP-binding protein [Candidatus Binataceae bacterium]